MRGVGSHELLGVILKHENNFDLLRLIAACQVVSSHADIWLNLKGRPSVFWLFPGVPIFFIISGFLITGSFMRDQSVPRYAKNRFLRIYPAMVASLFIMFLMMIFTGVIPLRAMADSNTYIYFATLVVTGSTVLANSISTPSFEYGPNTLPFFPGGVLWTIVVELGFYLVVPLLIGKRWTWPLLVLVLVASLWLAVEQVTMKNPWIDTTVPPYLWIFLLGAAVRLSWDKIGWLFKGTFPIWLTIHLLIWVGPAYKNPTPAVILSIITLAGCVLSFAHTLPSLSKMFRGTDISYGVYLYHMPIIMIFMIFGYKSEGWLWIAVYLATFAMAAISWRLVEKPFLSLKAVSLARPTLRTTA